MHETIILFTCCVILIGGVICGLFYLLGLYITRTSTKKYELLPPPNIRSQRMHDEKDVYFKY